MNRPTISLLILLATAAGMLNACSSSEEVDVNAGPNVRRVGYRWRGLKGFLVGPDLTIRYERQEFQSHNLYRNSLVTGL